MSDRDIIDDPDVFKQGSWTGMGGDSLLIEAIAEGGFLCDEAAAAFERTGRMWKAYAENADALPEGTTWDDLVAHAEWHLRDAAVATVAKSLRYGEVLDLARATDAMDDDLFDMRKRENQ